MAKSVSKNVSAAITKSAPAPMALESWEQELADEAKDEKSRESVGVPRITHRGGEFKIDNQTVGRSIKLAIVDFKMEKCYFGSKFDPQKPATPDCYAFGTNEAELVAHEGAPNPQNTVTVKDADGVSRSSSPCTGCKHNVFGTAEIGRGKACKDYRRLLVISPVLDKDGSVTLDENGVAKAEKRQLQVPPSSLKNWANYLSAIRDSTRTGNVREMIVQVETFALPQGGHGLKFSPVTTVSPEGLKALVALKKQSEGILTSAYPNIKEGGASEDDGKQAKKIRGKVGR